MTIMTRFIRLFKADMHGVMDQLEDRHLLLNHSLREMEEALDRKTRRLKRLRANLSDAATASRRTETELEKLESDLDAALRKERDDIARFLIRKRSGLQAHAASLARRIRDLENEIQELTETLDAQRRTYEEIRLKAGDMAAARRTAGWDGAPFPAGAAPGLSEEEIELELLRRKEALKGGVS